MPRFFGLKLIAKESFTQDANPKVQIWKSFVKQNV
jgi:hypothetical protein